MERSETPPTEDAAANGAFGDRLAAYYHLTKSETAAVSWSEKSTFAITRLRSDVGLLPTQYPKNPRYMFPSR